MALNSALIVLNNIHWYPGKSVLNDISCKFAQGEITGIVGPNGAGKSSLLRTIQRALIPDSGSITYESQNIAALNRQQVAQRIAVVPQSTAMLFDLTVFDIVRMALIPQKGLFEFDTRKDKQLVNECLEQTGCLDFISRKYNSLSGGEQQRVLLARALAQQTEVILLDEPTSHLDVFYQHQILGLLKSLKKTVLMTIHDINLAAQYCNSVIVLKDGYCLGQGVPAQILTKDVLSRAFDMPCAVSINADTALPTICFHP